MWININFTWPPTLAGIADTVQAMLANAVTELDASKTFLQAAPALSAVNNPVSADTVGALAAFNDLIDNTISAASVVCVHPWQQGVGQGVGHYRYLSPFNAVATAAAKMGDSADSHRPGNPMDCVVLLLTGQGFTSFAETLNAFNTVFTIPELQLCQRRAQQLSALEKQKQILPDAAVNARWRSRDIRNFQALRNSAEGVGELCAHAAGYETGAQSALDQVTALADKKAAAIDATAAALVDVVAEFAGGVGQCLFLNNKTRSQAKTELEASGVEHDAPLATCIVISGTLGELVILQEMFGL